MNQLMIVQTTTNSQHSTHLVSAENPRDVAAFYIEGLLPDWHLDKLKIKYSDNYARATAGPYSVEVRVAREPVLLVDSDFTDSRDLIAQYGEVILPQVIGDAS